MKQESYKTHSMSKERVMKKRKTGRVVGIAIALMMVVSLAAPAFAFGKGSSSDGTFHFFYMSGAHYNETDYQEKIDASDAYMFISDGTYNNGTYYAFVAVGYVYYSSGYLFEYVGQYYYMPNTAYQNDQDFAYIAAPVDGLPGGGYGAFWYAGDYDLNS